MAKFFINRPIVAMVLSILMTLIGLVAVSYTHLDVYKRQV